MIAITEQRPHREGFRKYSYADVWKFKTGPSRLGWSANSAYGIPVIADEALASVFAFCLHVVGFKLDGFVCGFRFCAATVAAESSLLAVALYYLVVAFNNLTDYNSNYQFVHHVLLMDSTFPGNHGLAPCRNPACRPSSTGRSSRGNRRPASSAASAACA